MDERWYEECVCDGGALTVGGETIICPGCERSPCPGYRLHVHEDVDIVEDEIDTADLYIA